MPARARLIAILSLACLASVVPLGPGGAAATAATPGEVTAFKVPGCLYGTSGFAAAPREGVLMRFCEKSGYVKGRTLARLLPSGEVARQKVPISDVTRIAAGPKEEVWEVGEELVRIAPDGSAKTYPLPSPKKNLTLHIYGLVPDGEGGVWVALGETSYGYGSAEDSTGGELMRVAADGIITSFPVPEEVEPQGLVQGRDGNLWFTGIHGRAFDEHDESEGTGYIGRMTPSGDFTLFPTVGTEPEGIAVGPEADLWFTETVNRNELFGRIGLDGKFGPSLDPHFVIPSASMTFGPEGDLWVSGIESGLVRITPADQETVYPTPIESPEAVVTGAEGNIWERTWKEVQRIVPGGPGIDVWSLRADRPKGKLSAVLACGGTARACEGTLRLALPRKGKKPPEYFARVPYEVAPEAQSTLRMNVPAKAFARNGRSPQRAPNLGGRIVIVRSTVEGGPTLTRKVYVPKLPQAG